MKTCPVADTTFRKSRPLRALVVSTLVVVVLSACSSAPSNNAEEYVGEYVFYPHGQSAGDSADILILKKNSAAVELRFSKESGEIATADKTWRLRQTSEGPMMSIGNFGHPIQLIRNEIRLGIAADFRTYYEKVR
jgi:hypothetical protein